MWKIRVGIRGMGCECGCRESAWECERSGWKYEKCGKSGWQYRESRWKLKYTVEITWNSNGNDNLKDWREVKIINLVSRI